MSDVPLTTVEHLRALLEGSPFHRRVMPIEISALDREAGLLQLKLAFRSEFAREEGTGRHHGGTIAALIDVTGAFAMIAATGRNVPTAALHVNYLRPAMDGSDLFGEGRVRQLGRSLGVVDVEITDLKGRLVALGRVEMNTAADR